MFNSYVKLPEGKYGIIWVFPLDFPLNQSDLRSTTSSQKKNGSSRAEGEDMPVVAAKIAPTNIALNQNQTLWGFKHPPKFW